MTKPESSKKSSTKEKTKKDLDTSNESKEAPSTAKDLFSEFSPADSDSENSDSPKEDCSEPASKKSKLKDSFTKRYAPKYKKEWENHPELKSWLSESIHGNTYFYCKFCKNDYRCGFSDIHKHMASKKHTMKAAMPAFQAQKFKFRGLLCPVFTPFITEKKIIPDINLKVIHKYASFLQACDIKGILINDITGEGMSLTIRERMDLLDTWSDTCEKTNQFLMVQIGGAPLKDVFELAKHASKREVGAVVVLPDIYNKPKTHLDLIKYIKLISEFTKNVPILYHHNPKFTNVNVDIPAFLLDITGEVDTFVGLIYSTNDIRESVTAMSINREKFTVFMGTDEAVLAAVATGFNCIMGVSLNFLPKLVQSICENVKQGDLKVAQTSQDLLNKTMEMILQEGDIAAFKAATEIIANTCGTTTREPIQTLWEGNVKKIQTKLRDLGVL